MKARTGQPGLEGANLKRKKKARRRLANKVARASRKANRKE